MADGMRQGYHLQSSASASVVEHLVSATHSFCFPTQSIIKMNRFFIVAALSALLGTNAFAPTPSTSRRVATTNLQFGIPTFQPKKDDESEKDPSIEEKKIGLGGFLQLLTAGLGAPFLGDYQGVDKETGKFMFSLEANNLVDESGESKQTKMPYFESGWVDPEDLAKEQKRKEQGFKFPWQK
jgi:hypothetical protein